MRKIKIDQFEGPLDLLLQLIEKQKLNIAEVSLARVTEQYIQALRQAENEISLDELADFLIVASKLLLIKSRALLPYLQIKEENETAQDLETQLKIYKKFYVASKVIQKIISKRKFTYSREKLLIKKEVDFRPPKGLTAYKMAKIFSGVLENLEPIKKLPQDFIKKSINISEKINQLREDVFKNTVINFKQIISRAKDKTEVIISFLALLELMKQKIVIVEQDSVFEDIKIRRI